MYACIFLPAVALLAIWFVGIGQVIDPPDASILQEQFAADGKMQVQFAAICTPKELHMQHACVLCFDLLKGVIITHPCVHLALEALPDSSGDEISLSAGNKDR